MWSIADPQQRFGCLAALIAIQARLNIMSPATLGLKTVTSYRCRLVDNAART
jgi:hypothetical protein